MDIDFQDIKENLTKTLLEAEDEIVLNRIEFMLEDDLFVDYLTNFIKRYNTTTQTADNLKQEFKAFLMENMRLNGTQALHPETKSGDISDSPE